MMLLRTIHLHGEIGFVPSTEFYWKVWNLVPVSRSFGINKYIAVDGRKVSYSLFYYRSYIQNTNFNFC